MGIFIGARAAASTANHIPMTGVTGAILITVMGTMGGLYHVMGQTIARAQAPRGPFIK